MFSHRVCKVHTATAFLSGIFFWRLLVEWTCELRDSMETICVDFWLIQCAWWLDLFHLEMILIELFGQFKILDKCHLDACGNGLYQSWLCAYACVVIRSHFTNSSSMFIPEKCCLFHIELSFNRMIYHYLLFQLLF